MATTYMNMNLPAVGDPDWAEKIIAALEDKIDAHDHDQYADGGAPVGAMTFEKGKVWPPLAGIVYCGGVAFDGNSTALGALDDRWLQASEDGGLYWYRRAGLVCLAPSLYHMEFVTAAPGGTPPKVGAMVRMTDDSGGPPYTPSIPAATTGQWFLSLGFEFPASYLYVDTDDGALIDNQTDTSAGENSSTEYPQLSTFYVKTASNGWVRL